MTKIFSLFALIAIFSLVALADIRPPETPKPSPKGKQIEMFVEVTNEVSEPTLVIKKSSAKMFRAALDEAEGVNDSMASAENKLNVGATQTVIGGAFLTLALVFGGVWFVRSKKPSKTVVGLFVAGILTTSTILVFANIAPPKNFGINKNMFTENFQRRAYARGKVQIKIVDDKLGDDIKLRIPMEDK